MLPEILRLLRENKARVTQLTARVLALVLIAISARLAGDQPDSDRVHELTQLAVDLAPGAVGVLLLALDLKVHKRENGGVIEPKHRVVKEGQYITVQGAQGRTSTFRAETQPKPKEIT